MSREMTDREAAIAWLQQVFPESGGWVVHVAGNDIDSEWLAAVVRKGESSCRFEAWADTGRVAAESLVSRWHAAIRPTVKRTINECVSDDDATAPEWKAGVTDRVLALPKWPTTQEEQ